MKEWMAQSGKGALLRLPENERAKSLLQHNMGLFLKGHGKFGEAEPLIKEAWEAQRRTRGSIINLAIFLNEQKRFNKAEQLLREASKSC